MAIRRICTKKPTNSSIADEFLGFCEASEEIELVGSSRKRADARVAKATCPHLQIPKTTLRDEFDYFAESS